MRIARALGSLSLLLLSACTAPGSDAARTADGSAASGAAAMTSASSAQSNPPADPPAPTLEPKLSPTSPPAEIDPPPPDVSISDPG